MFKKLSENELLTNDGFSAAVLSLFGCEVTALINPVTNRPSFKVQGNIRESLARIAYNEALGVLDLGREIAHMGELVSLLKHNNA